MARRYISTVRRRDEFRRRPGQRAPRSITLIVCEGETEQAYFDSVRMHFDLTTAEVVVAENTKGPAPISVVECAEKRAGEQGGYDTIFCVFDRDDHESFNRAREKIRGLATRKRAALDIRAIVSVPCFEFWVLLHFERTDWPAPACDDVVGRIRKNHLAGYKKADGVVTKTLFARLDTALAHAKWLASRPGIADENPSTTVHTLIDHLRAVGSKPVTP